MYLSSGSLKVSAFILMHSMETEKTKLNDHTKKSTIRVPRGSRFKMKCCRNEAFQ